MCAIYSPYIVILVKKIWHKKNYITLCEMINNEIFAITVVNLAS